MGSGVSWSTWLILAVAVAVGAYWRVDGLGELPLIGDEFHSLNVVDKDYATILRTYDCDITHMSLPLLQRAGQDLFGPGVLVFRLLAIVPGLLALACCYPVARSLVGRAPALLTTCALAASTPHIFYSRLARTYALTVLLALLLVGALQLAVRMADRPRWARWLAWTGVTLLAGVLPYAHLSTLGLVGTMALASLWQAWTVRRRPGDVLTPLVSFGLAACVTVLLYLPAWELLSANLYRCEGGGSPGPVSPMDVAMLLAGGHAAGFVGIALLPVAAVAMIMFKRRSGIWLTAAVGGTLVFVLASRPHTMAYGYTRFLLIVLPFMLMLVSWLIVAVVGRVVSNVAWAEHVALGSGIAAIAATYLTGPMAPWRPDDGPFSNTYLAMKALPTFDVPYPQTPPFYEALAADPRPLRIIETPTLRSRAVLLYRNYYLQHGKKTLLGWDRGKVATLRSKPYVHVADLEFAKNSGADYLILHHMVQVELYRYWQFVHEEAWPSQYRPADANLMFRHRTHHQAHLTNPAISLTFLIEQWRNLLGEPIYRDDLIAVWQLREDLGPG